MNEIEQELHDYIVLLILNGTIIHGGSHFFWGNHTKEAANKLDSFRAKMGSHESTSWNLVWDKAADTYLKIKNSPLNKALE